jgi:hypothetical protein
MPIPTLNPLPTPLPIPPAQRVRLTALSPSAYHNNPGGNVFRAANNAQPIPVGVRLNQSITPTEIVGGGQALDYILFNHLRYVRRIDMILRPDWAITTDQPRYRNAALALRDYSINGQFRRINGTVFVQAPQRNTSGFGNFVILADGVELYRSQNIFPGTTPFEFDVDISGVTTLRILFEYRNVAPNTGAGNSLQFGITGTQLTR